ncbi:cytochrome c oxidase subunit II [Trinickia sp.]|uniref:cytochrome c oxidase subunit II n=1 Tax=Trinickia sp. TaxID=2571163 RepID=UPI003F800C8A
MPALAAVLAVGATTCAATASQAADALQHSALAPHGVQAEHIARLWHLTVLVCGGVFAAVLVGVLFALMRRRRADRATPPDLRGNVEPERGLRGAVVGASVASVVLLVALVVADVLTDRALSKLPVANALHIELTGWQWWWQARYAADEGHPAFVTANELHVPAGRPIVVSLAAGDVIHSFWVPSLHGKKDLLPGIASTIEFRADRVGVYAGPCAEFCGAEHALMALRIVADPPDRYAAWAASQAAPAVEPSTAFTARGMQVFEHSACANCHTVRGTHAAGLLAPDLTHLMSRQTLAAGALANTAADLARWISDPNAVKPGTTMPPSRLSTPDLQALVAWLTTLK